MGERLVLSILLAGFGRVVRGLTLSALLIYDSPFLLWSAWNGQPQLEAITGKHCFELQNIAFSLLVNLMKHGREEWMMVGTCSASQVFNDPSVNHSTIGLSYYSPSWGRSHHQRVSFMGDLGDDEIKWFMSTDDGVIVASHDFRRGHKMSGSSILMMSNLSCPTWLKMILTSAYSHQDHFNILFMEHGTKGHASKLESCPRRCQTELEETVFISKVASCQDQNVRHAHMQAWSIVSCDSSLWLPSTTRMSESVETLHSLITIRRTRAEWKKGMSNKWRSLHDKEHMPFHQVDKG